MPLLPSWATTFDAAAQSLQLLGKSVGSVSCSGPLAAAGLSLGAIFKLGIRRESDQVVTTITLTPRLFHLTVAVLSVLLLALLVGYSLAENLAGS